MLSRDLLHRTAYRYGYGGGDQHRAAGVQMCRTQQYTEIQAAARGEKKPRPRRPRPAVCRSASIAVPSGAPSSAKRLACRFVESSSGYTRIFRAASGSPRQAAIPCGDRMSLSESGSSRGWCPPQCDALPPSACRWPSIPRRGKCQRRRQFFTGKAVCPRPGSPAPAAPVLVKSLPILLAFSGKQEHPPQRELFPAGDVGYRPL